MKIQAVILPEVSFDCRVGFWAPGHSVSSSDLPVLMCQSGAWWIAVEQTREGETWTKCIYIFIANVFPSFKIPSFLSPHLVLRLSHNKSKMPENTQHINTGQRKKRKVKTKRGMSGGEKRGWIWNKQQHCFTWQPGAQPALLLVHSQRAASSQHPIHDVTNHRFCQWCSVTWPLTLSKTQIDSFFCAC